MRIFGLLCMCLVACDDGGDARDGGSDMGAVDAGGAVEFEVVVEEENGLVPIDDGATVVFQWGFQGGTMIRPGVLVPAQAVEGLDEVRLTVRHRPDREHPDAYGDAGDFAGVVLDLDVRPYDADRRLIGPVDQQLGWADLAGVRLELDVTITAPTFEARQLVRLAIEGDATPCDAFPESGMSCVYRSVPGIFTVSAHAPAPDCPDAVVPMVAFEPHGAEAGRCLEWSGLGELAARPVPWPGLEGGADADCLDELGLGPTGSAPGEIALQVNGTCSPITIEPFEDFSACALCQ